MKWNAVGRVAAGALLAAGCSDSISPTAASLQPHAPKAPSLNIAGTSAVTEAGIVPFQYSGNGQNTAAIACGVDQTTGLALGFKVEGNGNHAASAGEPVTVTILGTGDNRKILAWAADANTRVSKVIVKGSDGFNEYIYGFPAASSAPAQYTRMATDGVEYSSDAGLLSPTNNGGNLPAISHYIVCTGPSDTPVTPQASLSVTTSASATYNRTWTWSISKTAEPTSAMLQLNTPLTINYAIGLNWTSSESNHAIGGSVTVTAGGNRPTTVTSVAINLPQALIDAGGTATLGICTPAVGSELSSGDTMTCSYGVTGFTAPTTYPTSYGFITATAMGTAAGVSPNPTGESVPGSANEVKFDAANESGKTINLSDVYSGPGTLASGTPAMPPTFTAPSATGSTSWTASATFSYTSASACGSQSVTNTASFTGGAGTTSGGQNTQTATTNITVQCQTITVRKFYDADANGTKGSGEPYIGWSATLSGPAAVGFPTTNPFTFGPAGASFTGSFLGSYTVTEGSRSGWYNTTPTLVTKSIIAGGSADFTFGNVCVGAGGGLTLGYWSNRNGESDLTSLGGGMNANLARLRGLNLRTASGVDFDPQFYREYRTWLLDGNAVNMAYMLSVQLSAMSNNVATGKVAGGRLIYAPNTNSANAYGFATVADVMAEANTSLGSSGNTSTAGATRTYQEWLMKALDNANNNRNFVQLQACS